MSTQNKIILKSSRIYGASVDSLQSKCPAAVKQAGHRSSFERSFRLAGVSRRASVVSLPHAVRGRKHKNVVCRGTGDQVAQNGLRGSHRKCESSVLRTDAEHARDGARGRRCTRSTRSGRIACLTAEAAVKKLTRAPCSVRSTRWHCF